MQIICYSFVFYAFENIFFYNHRDYYSSILESNLLIFATLKLNTTFENTHEIEDTIKNYQIKNIIKRNVSVVEMVFESDTI